MKTLISALLWLCVASVASAQPSTEIVTAKRSSEDLRKLLAPIALYPDALVALILPASTNSADVVLAARFLASQGDSARIDSQPWDQSVKSLARYPDVIKWMDENLEWTREVGEAFAIQPADLMNMVQTLRTEAQAAGLLTDTPQQKVVVREKEICIVPAQETLIYVPYYDPEVLIVHRPFQSSWLSFGAGFAVGSWLNYDCDWRSRRVLIHRHEPGWKYRSDWRWSTRDTRVSGVHRHWRPNPQYLEHVHHQPRRENRPVPVVRPHRFGETDHNRRSDDQRRWDARQVERRNDLRNRTQDAENRTTDETRDLSRNRRNIGVPDGTPSAPPRDFQRNGEQRRWRGQTGISGGGVGRTESTTTPPAVVSPTPGIEGGSGADGSSSATQSRRQNQERRYGRPGDSGGQRRDPHPGGGHPDRGPGISHEARSIPQAPRPERERRGGYSSRESAPVADRRHEAREVAREVAPPRETRARYEPPAAAAVATPAPAAHAPASATEAETSSRRGGGGRGADRNSSPVLP